ncbi:MAG: NAD(P)/FAD-dependent oxidoreductase [Gammaproteobacteria bacterium]|nr:NAD(P)/FAD-dependent oxidoreductase [Gammaproteobacteria bacterium]
MKKEKLILIGNGMAGVRALEELINIAPEMYDITVFGSEPYGNYNRILLSPVLAGEKSFNDILLNDDPWYEQHRITLHKGREVTEINRRAKTVVTRDGVSADYDRLLLATGSNPVILPVPGHKLPGVITFRDISDVDTMINAAQTMRHAVVIGGGLLGLEAAYGLKQRGLHVTVVHLMKTLLERQLDDVAGGMLLQSLEKRGIQFLLGAQTEEIIGKQRVQGVRFKDGREISADLVVMAIGIRPNIELAKKSGIHCERGIVVNDTLQTYDPKIYAVGECVQHRTQTYGLVAPLFEQAKVCANHLAQIGFRRYQGSMTSTKLKVTGVDVFSAGDFTGDATTESIVLRDGARGMYKKLVIKDNRIHGAVMIGDTGDGPWYFQMMRDRQDISDIRSRLLHGQAHLGDAGHGGATTIGMSDATEICGCNGVCKGEIVNAIIGKKLFTLEEVRSHTKASSSCGSCTGLVEQILAATLGGDYSAAPKEKPLCPCTDYTHDEVRQAIREQRLHTIDAVMRRMEWKNSDGCASCRPALNYYLISTWPAETKDDYQARFINERAHANIQKDGTYSVVPRIWGGVVTPKELHAIAAVAEQFEVPEVKITGGQRIDLLGVKKENLPAVWRELGKAGLVSGHAYAKALRTVKTCVGQEWCRFGVQNSTQMGITLEKMTWGSWTPHKFKMAVSGCPRNCAEATIKDFGVVAVESGWELHVGGNGGVKVRVTDLLCKVKTEQEVLEYCGAFMQLYREEARYLERTAPWIERVGLSYVKQQLIEDADKRRALYARFLDSQKYVQTDPWAQRAAAEVHTHEFIPLKQVV